MEEKKPFQRVDDVQDVSVTFGKVGSVYPCLVEKYDGFKDQEGKVKLFNSTFENPIELYESEFNEAVEREETDGKVNVFGI